MSGNFTNDHPEPSQFPASAHCYGARTLDLPEAGVYEPGGAAISAVLSAVYVMAGFFNNGSGRACVVDWQRRGFHWHCLRSPGYTKRCHAATVRAPYGAAS
jgi:hypothetical protein